MRVLFPLLTVLALFEPVEAQRCGRVTPTAHRSGIFTAGVLEGRVLGDLYAGYTGVRGRVPGKVQVDPARQLDSLWRVKRSCYPGNNVVRQLHQQLLNDYRGGGKTHTTIDQFISIAEREVTFVQREMNWENFRELYGLNGAQLSLVRDLARRIDGRDLVAYGMTEIMPSADGNLNVQVLEFLLRNYGREFVYAIPARHDRFASFGFFQFTSRAVFDANGRLEGASRASRGLRSGNLPGSAMRIQGDLQHRAAYLFALHNIASLVKRLNGTQRTRLAALPASKHDDLIQFIAAAHNGPAYAQTAAMRWLDNRMRLEYFVSVSNSSVRRYAQKTRANLVALRSSESLDGSLYGTN